ncbi:MAG TPA: RNA polymerase sigma factor region1.1 domain-containing protein, partial [Holophagaceae bacterium]|nr:RNA polymerase sigma factor region1.1 domain-containing protein [Holophagaceae bacterium]
MVPMPNLDTYFELTKALISLGRNRGYILVDELNSFLPPSASTPADIEALMGLFARLGVGVGATEEEALLAKEQIEPEYTA